jgi:lysozyme
MSTDKLRTGIKGITLIKKYESLHDGDLSLIGLQPKMDPSDLWTEGWGHLIIDPITNKLLKGSINKSRAYELSRIKDPNLNDEFEAEHLLENDLLKSEAIIKNRIKNKVNLLQHEFDALVSHVFNTGGSEKLFKLILKAAPKKEIEHWWTSSYITSGGVFMLGLSYRRRTECHLFFNNELKFFN